MKAKNVGLILAGLLVGLIAGFFFGIHHEKESVRAWMDDLRLMPVTVFNGDLPVGTRLSYDHVAKVQIQKALLTPQMVMPKDFEKVMGKPLQVAAHKMSIIMYQHFDPKTCAHVLKKPEEPAPAAAPPAFPLQDRSWKAVSKTPPATSLKMGSFLLRFEETTLDQLRAKAKGGRIAHQGDAGDSLYSLCYTAPQARIWVTSSGEMGGENHAVTGFVAQRAEGIMPTGDCPALPKELQPLSFDGGLWLGDSEKKASKILGPPSHNQGPLQFFDYQSKVPGACKPDGFDRLNWLLLKIQKGRLVEIHAGQVTSC